MARPFFRIPLRGLLQPRIQIAASVRRPYSQPGSSSRTLLCLRQNLGLPAPLQSENSRPLGFPWRVVVAVCVQRLPTLSKDTADVERRYRELKVHMSLPASPPVVVFT